MNIKKKLLIIICSVIGLVVLALFINSLIERPLIKEEERDGYKVENVSLILNRFEYTEDYFFTFNRSRVEENMTLAQHEKFFEDLTKLALDAKIMPRYTLYSLKDLEKAELGVFEDKVGGLALMLVSNINSGEICWWFYFDENNNFARNKDGSNFIKYKIVNAEEIQERLVEILIEAGVL